jgi:hypothetical protein
MDSLVIRTFGLPIAAMIQKSNGNMHFVALFQGCNQAAQHGMFHSSTSLHNYFHYHTIYVSFVQN